MKFHELEALRRVYGDSFIWFATARNRNGIQPKNSINIFFLKIFKENELQIQWSESLEVSKINL